ncbi:MAG: hypothetical protein ACX93P_15315 [Roseovarius sp.]
MKQALHALNGLSTFDVDPTDFSITSIPASIAEVTFPKNTKPAVFGHDRLTVKPVVQARKTLFLDYPTDSERPLIVYRIGGGAETGNYCERISSDEGRLRSHFTPLAPTLLISGFAHLGQGSLSDALASFPALHRVRNAHHITIVAII